MYYKNVCIEAFGYELPENRISSDELEKRLAPVYEKLKLPFGRLELMSGITERRFWNKGSLPSEGSIKAGKKAIEKAGITGKELSCLIHASVSKDFLEPATATVIHRALDISSSAIVFDVSNACLGFINGMMILANMIELGQVKMGIIVAGEHAGPLVETTIEQILLDPTPSREKLKSSFASFTIGSGAAAVILTHKDISKTGHRLLGGIGKIDSQNNDLCNGGTQNVDLNSHWESQPILMKTASEKLLQEGCRLARETWFETRKEIDWENVQVDRFFCHQVGRVHRKSLFEHLGENMEKDYSTFQFLGNMGSASLPVTMAMGIEENLLRPGQKIGILGIGSGINCFMFGVEW